VLKDFLGRAINCGDTVVYACRQGSALWLQKMQVSEVDESRSVIKGYNEKGRQISIKNLTNVMVAPNAALSA
jgi:hypothetical protein